MRIQPFEIAELEFAWCHRVYVRFRTHRCQPVELLVHIQKETLSELLKTYGVNVLEFSADQIDIRALLSLQAPESVSSAVSKFKGRLSKWLNEQNTNDSVASKPKWLGRGYFASTTGKSTADEVAAYLERQAEHHGYDGQATPSVFIKTYYLGEQEERILATDHAVTCLRYHVVLATQWRRGVFSFESASEVVDCWRAMQPETKAVIQKVSILADHVHLALMIHPTVSPAVAVTAWMNAAQNLMWKRFEGDLIRSRIDRLWQPNAYVGSFGQLRSAAVASYVRRWESQED